MKAEDLEKKMDRQEQYSRRNCKKCIERRTEGKYR